MMKVLIVGAGPTGLTAALEFVRQGIIPEIIDAKEGPSQLSRAVGILPQNIEDLKGLGVGQRIVEEGTIFDSIQIQYSKDSQINLSLSKILGQNHAPISLPQDRTEALMSEVLQEKGVVVQYGRKAVNITTDQDEAIVTFADGVSKKYDWVIGADGVSSTVRDTLGIAFLGYELAETWSIADIELGQESKYKSFSVWILGEMNKDIMVMVPIGRQRVRLVSSTPDCVAALPIGLDIQNIRRAGTFKISIRQANTYVMGRVVLAGDAAHTHSPVGGRGMNLGIADAIAAVQAIVEGTPQKYNFERRKAGARVIAETERVRKALISNNILITYFIKILFFIVQNIHFAQKKFAQNMTKL